MLSTLLAQAAQVMPVTGKVVSIVLAVVFFSRVSIAFYTVVNSTKVQAIATESFTELVKRFIIFGGGKLG